MNEFLFLALGLPCTRDEECSHTDFSSCRSDVCDCNQDYVKSKTDLKCLLKSQNFSSLCYEDIQCSSSFGFGSICDNGLCSCTELHQYKASINKCVLDARKSSFVELPKDLITIFLGLGEECSTHTDCHQPGHGESRLECIIGICKCKPDYFEDEGYCISSQLIFILSVCCPLLIDFVSDSSESSITFSLHDILPFIISYIIFYIII